MKDISGAFINFGCPNITTHFIYPSRKKEKKKVAVSHTLASWNRKERESGTH